MNFDSVVILVGILIFPHLNFASQLVISCYYILLIAIGIVFRF